MKTYPEDKLKILLWDIETACPVVYSWGLGQQYINFGQVIHEGYILCISWKWLGEKKIHSVQLTPAECKARNDKRILKEFSQVLNKADYYVGHNVKDFDLKMINTGLITHKLPPVAPSQILDTLKLSRQNFKFLSNKMDAICQKLELGRKAETGGFALWKACMSGCPKAMKKMVKYNKQDIVINENLFERILPFINLPTRLNTSVILDTDKLSGILARYRCPTCNSKGMDINKKYVTKAGNLRLACRCKACYACTTIAGGKA